MNTQERVLGILRQVSSKPDPPTPDESLFESGYLDSFALADLVNALETEFHIKVPDADLTPRKFDSVSRIESYVESRL